VKPVRWGVLGAARIAEAVVPAIASTPGSTVAAIASRDPARAQAFAAKHGIARAYAGYADLLADPDIDAVYVPLPAAEHATWALACAAAGKAALIEKPFATNAAEAATVVAAFADRGALVGEALMYRFHPLTRRVRQLVVDGAVGRVATVRASFSVAIPPGDIRWRSAGGGALLDLGCYCVSVLRLMAGGEPTTATARATWAEPGVDAAFAGALGFPGGALGHFACGMRAHFDCSYEIVGDAGRLRVDRGAMVAWPGEAFAIGRWSAQGETRETVPAADHYQLMVASFADAVRGRAPYAVPPDETLANLRVMDALRADAVAATAAPLAFTASR